jgi:hypothetical protein
VRIVRSFERLAFGLAGLSRPARVVRVPNLWPLTLFEPLLFWLCLPSLACCRSRSRERRWRSVVAHAAVLAASPCSSRIVPAPFARRRSAGAPLARDDVERSQRRCERRGRRGCLRSSGADVVLLTEVGTRQAAGLQDALRDVYPSACSRSRRLGIWPVQPVPHRLHELFRVASTRAYLDCRLEVAGRTVRVIGVHLPLPQVLLGPFGSSANRHGGHRPARGAAARACSSSATSTRPRRCASSRRCATRASATRSASADPARLHRPVAADSGAGCRCLSLARIDFVWHTPDIACVECTRRIGRGLRSTGRSRCAASVLGER